MKSRKTAGWSRLDNAAKLFPPTSNKADPKVFRFACELTEPVDPVHLQTALDRTLVAFTHYKSVLRKGLFWYYLEESSLPALVQEEDLRPCNPLYDKVKKNLLFSVTYYKCRINLEVYHALSDGTGALHFLKSLVCHYLTLRHPGAFPDGLPPVDYDASSSQITDDSFYKHYIPVSQREKRRHVPVAYRIQGARLSEHRIRVIEGQMSVKSVLTLAKAHHTTITAFLTAVLMCAIREDMPARELEKPVVLTIPVNLRNYFASQSARNFFGVVNVGYCFRNDNALEQVVQAVTASFERELTADRLNTRMNEFSALEHNAFARIVPLAFKDVTMQIANRIKKREVTGTLSNVGKVTMPDETAPYIRLFDVFASTNRLYLCLCSYRDTLVLTFTAPFVSTDIQKRFFRILAEMGIEIVIQSNEPDDR